jgi:acylglycerol lipase
LTRLLTSAYGRYTLPPHVPHLEQLHNPDIIVRNRRVFLAPYQSFTTLHEAYDSTHITHAEDVHLTEDEIESGVRRGGRWVTYSVWEMKKPEGGWEAGGGGEGRDLVLVHGKLSAVSLMTGLSDYGMRYTPHVGHFLKAGFRVIMPDMPSVCLSCVRANPSMDGRLGMQCRI